ncbi:MAG: patatin-like phospholipase family protein [Actinomycetota bacterium]
MTVRQRISHRLRPRAAGRFQARGTAFVFSGGGTYGAMQLGQVRALFNAGITPDMVVGTSIGAINATALAADPTPNGLQRLVDIWMQMRTEDIFPGGSWKRALLAIRRGDHLYSNEGLRRVIACINARRFEDLQIPAHVVAAHLGTGSETVFDSGPIAPAVLASAALPGVFPPVVIDGEPYTDGGVVNNTPISVAVAAGATKIFVINCGHTNQVQREVRRPLDVMVQAFAHSRASRVDHDLERFAKVAKIKRIPVSDPPIMRYDDLSHTAALIEQAEAETTAWLRSR